MIGIIAAGAGVVAGIRWLKKRAAAAPAAPDDDGSSTPAPLAMAPLPITAAPLPDTPLRPYIRNFAPRMQPPTSLSPPGTLAPPLTTPYPDPGKDDC